MAVATASLPVPALTARLAPAAGAQAVRQAAAAEKAEPTDRQLFDAALAGNRDALGKLIGRHERAVFGLLVRLTNGDRHRADDLFQEAFLHALRAADTFDRKLEFKPWLTAIAVNLVRDEARKRKVRGEVPLEGGVGDEEYERACAVADDNPGDNAERHDEEDRIRRALTRLTLLEREVVLLHFYQSMTLVETAGVLGVALGTVKSRLHAALTRLSRMLGPPEE